MATNHIKANSAGRGRIASTQKRAIHISKVSNIGGGNPPRCVYVGGADMIVFANAQSIRAGEDSKKTEG